MLLGVAANVTTRKFNANDVPLLHTKTRYAGGGVDEQLPPPPSPPQLKEAGQLDGVPRPNSVDRILHPDGSQHILTSHEAVNKLATVLNSQRRVVRSLQPSVIRTTRKIILLARQSNISIFVRG
ncbi:hypothetical protein WN51_07582 [Melipona quadrifasciata]|uniref:Uncharacterized protein n=1 Tax=Melipona quadrifasciata TaxID=166423 RepID=A0A0N0U6T0_9HYME|nr:hypothetical protein WN51_07582 [Melipona quadrifasciata]